MDHIGVKARLESSKLVLEKIKALAGNEPVILTGDFNSDQTSEGYKIISGSGILQDSYETAEVRYATNGTFNNFNPQQKTDIRIDHIFVSKGFRVMRYGVLTDTYWTETGKGIFVTRMPSDHFPVKVVITLDR
jgi:endonuclease/exonuclease/phosphatase family metal-dependent hydrolase